MTTIRKVPLNGGTTRYRFVVDVGINPATGKRKQLTVTKATGWGDRYGYYRAEAGWSA